MEPLSSFRDAPLGAVVRAGGRTSFRVWAPYARAVELVLEGDGARSVPMEPEERGYFAAAVEGAGPGTRYRYRLDPSGRASPTRRLAGSRTELGPSPYRQLFRAGRASPSPLRGWEGDRGDVGVIRPGVFGPSAVPPADLFRSGPVRAGASPSPLRGWEGDRGDVGVIRPGVFGPSAVPPAFPPRNGAEAVAVERRGLLFYEIHVGTFTPEGTFDAAIRHLPRFAELGVTALELLPVAEFSGARNWGYDGVFPFAAQSTYGGPAGLRRLVDAAHRAGLACFLDVVYNHLGPEGSVHGRFGPYATERYRTPWGPAPDFDGPGSDEVRRHFVESALWWLADVGLDGLRLDAVHAISDLSERPFLAELSEAVDRAAEALGRPLALIAESATNTLRFLRPREDGGAGCAGQWSDDLHHALHAVLTGERDGFYADFGRLEQLATAYRRGWVYTGQPSVYRGRRHGEPFRGVPGMTPDRLVVFVQNHDLTGNRARGERLAALLRPPPFEAAKLAAAAVLLSPFVPLLFMGEEYGETAPFLFFTDHAGRELAEAVRRGRRRDFAGSDLASAWAGEVPDPQAPATFACSKLDPGLRAAPGHRQLEACYRELLRLRREVPGLGTAASWDGIDARADEAAGVLTLRRGDGLVALLDFAPEPRTAALPPPCDEARSWHKLFDSAATAWGGPGEMAPAEAKGSAEILLPPYSAVLYARAAGSAPP